MSDPSPTSSHGTAPPSAAHPPGASRPPDSSDHHLPPGSPPLLVYIHVRFREAFGEPSSTLALDSQWTLQSRPEVPAIFVLVNGSHEKPAVWIFDPYSASNVWRTSIVSNEGVDQAIEEIHRRTAAAAMSWSQARRDA